MAASPRSSVPHFTKGQVLRAQYRYDEAISEYETVIALNRNWAHAYSHLGWCKFMTGSIEALIPAQEQAIGLSPRDRPAKCQRIVEVSRDKRSGMPALRYSPSEHYHFDRR